MPYYGMPWKQGAYSKLEGQWLFPSKALFLLKLLQLITDLLPRRHIGGGK